MSTDGNTDPAEARSSAFRHKFARRRRILAVCVVAGVLLLIFGGLWVREKLTHVDENDARIDGEVTTIASRVDGWLMSRTVDEGARVKKGQILAEIDTRDAKLRLSAVENDIVAHEAEVRQISLQRDSTQASADAGVEAAQAQTDEAEASRAINEHQAELADADFARLDALFENGAVSKQDWEHADSQRKQAHEALREAEAALMTRKAELKAARAELGQVPVLTQQIEVLRAETAVLQAQAAQIRQEIEDRTLRSPFDGVVDKTFIHAGDYVQAGQWLMMMHDPANVWVEANVRETDVGRLAVGQTAEISVDAYPGLHLSGQVINVGDAATNQFALLPSPNPSGNFTKITQRVPVRIALDECPRELQPGLMVEVSVDVAH